MAKTFGILFLLLTTGLSVLVAASERSNHGEPCTSTRKCNKRAYLTCDPIENICKCSRSDAMTFEPSSNRCVVKVGDQCKFTVDSSDENGRTVYQYFPCISNADCGSDGFCACSPGHYETSNATCAPYGSYKQQCSSTEPCFAELGLHCSPNNVCDCNSTTSVYDYKQGRCVGLINSPCLEGTCVDNAFCSATAGQCKCSSGYFAHSPAYCAAQLAHGGSCAEDSQCGNDTLTGSSLVCVNGKCDCDPSKSVFGRASRYTYEYDFVDASTQTMCAPKERQPCFKGYCAPSTQCSDPWRDDFPINQGVCRCPSGKTMSATSELCSLGYGSSCSASESCADILSCYKIANERSPLCRCPFPDLQTYDSSKGRCVSKAYGPCTSDLNCQTSAHCRKTSGGDDSSGHCVCNEGYVPAPDGSCKLTYNQTCTSDSECDPVPKLKCMNFRCGCQSFSMYSPGKRSCLGLVGARCRSAGQCIPNADCAAPYLGYPEVCTCAKGYVEAGNYTCALPPQAEVAVSSSESEEGLEEPGPGENAIVAGLQPGSTDVPKL